MTTEAGKDVARERAAMRDIAIVLGLIVGGVALVALGDREHAGMLFAGALAFAVPSSRLAPARVPPQLVGLGVGVGAALALSACAPSSAAGGSVPSWGAWSVGAGMIAAGAIVLLARRWMRRRARAVVGLSLALAASGCSGAQWAHVGGVAHTVATVTCGAARKLADACAATGLGPHEPCPLALELSPGVRPADGRGGEASPSPSSP